MERFQWRTAFCRQCCGTALHWNFRSTSFDRQHWRTPQHRQRCNTAFHRYALRQPACGVSGREPAKPLGQYFAIEAKFFRQSALVVVVGQCVQWSKQWCKRA